MAYVPAMDGGERRELPNLTTKLGGGSLPRSLSLDLGEDRLEPIVRQPHSGGLGATR
jgi:hypothetical protein